jgi:hypothetical protein
MKPSATLALALALALTIGPALAAGPDLPLMNGESLNKLAANKLAANGIIANGVESEPGDATPMVRVRTVTLADGTVLTVAPSR